MECELSTHIGQFLFEYFLAGDLKAQWNFCFVFCVVLRIDRCTCHFCAIIIVCSDALYWGTTDKNDHSKTLVISSYIAVFYLRTFLYS